MIFKIRKIICLATRTNDRFGYGFRQSRRLWTIPESHDDFIGHMEELRAMGVLLLRILSADLKVSVQIRGEYCPRVRARRIHKLLLWTTYSRLIDK